MAATAEYMIHVDALARRIATGALKPGDRLPPQRRFAYETGIAVSTAARVYGELLRRGLVVGEVGRGTFVAGRAPAAIGVRAEALEGRIDLDFNFPTIPQQAGLIARSAGHLQRPEAVAAAFAPVTGRRIEAARQALAPLAGAGGWTADPAGLAFTGCGRQSIAAAISALVPIGGRLAVEAVSYPLVKSLTARLGVVMVPIGMDEEGLRPDLLARAHRAGAVSAIYLQPILHNPLGITMGARRRAEILRMAEKLGVEIIEDIVYSFLADVPPLAAEAPERCLVADSLSKRVAAGAGLGWAWAPERLRDRLASAIRTGAWNAGPLALELATRMMADGTMAEITRLKRDDARVRQGLVAECLAGYEHAADPRSYHVWLKLPEGWRSDTFAAAAARAGISLTPSSAFAMVAGHAPNAVRLGLGLPGLADLRTALQRLAQLLRAGSETVDITE
ncbi:MAG: PLP-dependent aminotransferase family protein [Hyphomicrobiaceae bacterium]|nr:PLP-dependent aminotransferase family protein [Hyphomicrobiaceae bacterium]